MVKSDVFPMLLHYRTDGDRLSITGRMAGSNRGSKTPLWLEQGLIDRVPVGT